MGSGVHIREGAGSDLGDPPSRRAVAPLGFVVTEILP